LHLSFGIFSGLSSNRGPTLGLVTPAEAPKPAVRLDRDGPIARIVLARPARRNALSLAVMEEVLDRLDEVEGDPEVQVVVITGDGPAFSAGHDLGEMTAEHDAAFYDKLFATCGALMSRLHALPQPVIAEVRGVATAAGCQLVAACDLAVAAEDARFATPGVNIGLFCSTPMVPLSRAIGRKRALEMLFTGEMIDAATAAEWGLVNRVVPETELTDAVNELARQIAKASPAVVALGKRTFYAQDGVDEAAAYALTCAVMADNAQMDDAQEGMRAFLEKRTPRWGSANT
jgi:enoyl-CoA hydratase/carnithine racemase